MVGCLWVAGDGLACCTELRDLVLLALEKQWLLLFGVFVLMGRNIALPLKLGGEQKEDERSLRGSPGWCGASVASGEGEMGVVKRCL